MRSQESPELTRLIPNGILLACCRCRDITVRSEIFRSEPLNRMMGNFSLFNQINLPNPFASIRAWQYARNAPPGVGVDAQAVLQPYIGDYDVYVGVMRHRLGTPTRRAASGTVEEFQDARRRWEKTGRPAIFFYFGSDVLDG